MDEDGELKVIHARDKTTIADFIVGGESESDDNDVDDDYGHSDAVEAADANRVERQELPKWARDLDDEEVARRLQAEENARASSAGALRDANAATTRKSLDAEKVRSATRGFAELEIGPKSQSSSSASATKAATSSDRNTESAWTTEEQARLEEALKQFPGAASDKERWKNIAEFVGRSRKDCVMRFRFCQALVKKKAEETGDQ